MIHVRPSVKTYYRIIDLSIHFYLFQTNQDHPKRLKKIKKMEKQLSPQILDIKIKLRNVKKKNRKQAQIIT